jgi:tRNA A58 N-methylase Trm61
VEVDCLMLSAVNLLAMLKDLVQLRGVDVTSKIFASKIVDVVILDER